MSLVIGQKVDYIAASNTWLANASLIKAKAALPVADGASRWLGLLKNAARMAID